MEIQKISQETVLLRSPQDLIDRVGAALAKGGASFEDVLRVVEILHDAGVAGKDLS